MVLLSIGEDGVADDAGGSRGPSVKSYLNSINYNRNGGKCKDFSRKVRKRKTRRAEGSAGLLSPVGRGKGEDGYYFSGISIAWELGAPEAIFSVLVKIFA